MATDTRLTDIPEKTGDPSRRSLSGVFPPLARWILFAWMTGVILCAFFVVPPAKGLGPLTPILYFHVPMAWNGALGLIAAAIYSGFYLRTRRIEWDTKAVASAELGFLFCILATASGALWARGAWGAWWSWDPKQTSIAVLILLYGAYFALRSAVETRPARATLGGAYAVLSAITVPMLMHVIPYYLEKMGLSMHPYSVTRGEMDPRIFGLLMASWAGFLGLYLWLLRLRVAVGRVDDARQGLE